MLDDSLRRGGRGTKGEDIFTFFNSKELKLDVSLRRGGRGIKGEEVG
jgi:hypothetical protein